MRETQRWREIDRNMDIEEGKRVERKDNQERESHGDIGGRKREKDADKKIGRDEMWEGGGHW